MFVRFIDIKYSFTENKYENYKLANELGYVEHIMDKSKESSTFEVLSSNGMCKVYFDIEHIPSEDDKIIYDIVKSLISELINKTDLNVDSSCISYLITENKHSSTHEGRSYHVILYNCVMFKQNMRAFLNYYIANKLVGYEYIDNSVYSSNRLFRAVNQRGVRKEAFGTERPPEDDKHVILTYYDADTKADTGLSERDLITNSVIQAYVSNKVYRPCLNMSLKEKHANKYKANENIKYNFSDGSKRIGRTVHNTYIFNAPITKETVDVIKGMDIDDHAKRVYDTVYVLHELLMITNPKEAILEAVNEILTYYKEHNGFEGYKMTLQQIETMTKIIESKITL